MNYQETTEYLFSSMPSFQNVGAAGYKPGLERIAAFAEQLGNPHLQYPTIHVAGTNGKGSTSHMLASVLQSAGYRVGLFTSPHLRDFRERIRIDGQMISEREVVEFVARNREAMEQLQLSFFEMTAAMAFDHFVHGGVDVAVIECGLGGRLDATNIVVPQLSIITNIGIDHTQYLGDTVEKIAAEKAGIIKSGVTIVLGDRGCDGMECGDVIEAKAIDSYSRMIYAQDRYDINSQYVQGFILDLLGNYQRKNLVTILAAIDILRSRFAISDAALRYGLVHVCRQTGLMGRWQVLTHEPLMVCDTGHNPHGLSAVVEQIEQVSQGYERLICVLGFAKDKDVRAILRMFPSGAHFIFTKAAIERAHGIETLAMVGDELLLDYECCEGVAQAVELAHSIAAKRDMIFIGGSTFVVAEVNLY